MASGLTDAHVVTGLIVIGLLAAWTVFHWLKAEPRSDQHIMGGDVGVPSSGTGSDPAGGPGNSAGGGGGGSNA
jgi:hypothetical protein